MHRLPDPARRWRRRAAALFAVVAAVLTLTATTAASAATGPGFYALEGVEGTAFHVLSTGNLVTTEADDSVFFLATSGRGLTRLPFALHAYNQAYQNIALDSNGFVELGVTAAQVQRSQ